MEERAKSLVGRRVEIHIGTRMGSFLKIGRIASVSDGVIRLKGPSGLETSVPLKDKWVVVKSIEERAHPGEET
jgi:hypothetical protein